jgi:hypothetical protein
MDTLTYAKVESFFKTQIYVNQKLKYFSNVSIDLTLYFSDKMS